MHDTKYSVRTASPPGIAAEGLGKRYGDLWALRELDLDVPAGTVLGLLGHNGAGKTTAVRILTTLAQPTTGSARVAGSTSSTIRTASAPGSASPRSRRPSTGCSRRGPTSSSSAASTTSRSGRPPARRRAARAPRRSPTTADRLVKTFSGGMRRRLDLAATLVATPPVLFLDEPTTGLDPHSRNELWELLRELVRDGTTLLLTTQYLEEADRLADDIVVLDHGRSVAHGSPATLKARIGGERIDVTVAAPADLAPAAEALAEFADGPATSDPAGPVVTVPVRPGTPLLDVVRALDCAASRRPTSTVASRRSTTSFCLSPRRRSARPRRSGRRSASA